MRKTFALVASLLVAVLFFACEKKLEQPTLPDEKIARIMADLFVADAATNGLSGYSKDSLAQIYFKQVLEMHGVTKESYEKDLRLMADDLPRLERVVQQAEALLGDGNKEEGDKETELQK